MATREIKTRFVLEGEQKFRSTMKQSAQAIKVLNSEQKLAAAQFKQSGDAEKYAAKQTEILKAKIEEQKAAVAAAEEAIKHLTENGIDQNSQKMQQWKIKLNDAKSALVKMETDLANVGAESADAATQTDELGDSLSSLDKKASIDAVIKGVERLSDGIGGTINKVKELATGLVDELKKAASWADDLSTQATIFGYDRETLQRMQYAAKIVDTDVETIVSARTKLEKAMSSESEDTLQAFAQLGIHTKRYGKYRDWEEVFWEAGDALMHMTDGLDATSAASAEVVRENTAMAIFGKSWRELIPLFKAGREGYKAAMDSAAVVSEEDVDKLTELDDALAELENKFDVLQKTVLAQLAPTLTELSNALSKVLGEFNEYLQSEEGQAKLAELGEAISGLFSDLTNVDFSTALETVKDTLGKVIDALSWLKTNGASVKLAVEGIVTAWMALKATEGIMSVIQLINGMKGMNPGSNGPTVPKGGGDAVATSGGALGFLSVLKAAIPNALAAFGTWEITKLLPADLLTFLSRGSAKEVAEITKNAGIKTVGDAMHQVEANPEQSKKSIGLVLEAVVNPTAAEDYKTHENGKAFEEQKKALEAALSDELAGMDPLQAKIQMQAVPEKPAGSDGYWSNGGPVEVLKEEAEKDSPALDASMAIIGGNAAAGLAEGIDERADEAVQAAQRMGEAVSGCLRRILEVQSPSKVFEEIGEYVGLGFAQGMDNEMETVTRAAERMAGAAMISPGTGRGGNMVDVTLMIGPERMAEILVPLVNDGLGAEIGLARR